MGRRGRGRQREKTAEGEEERRLKGQEGRGGGQSGGQCFGSGSVSGLDPDSMGSLDPDPDLGGQKMNHKNKKKLIKFIWSSMFSFEV